MCGIAGIIGAKEKVNESTLQAVMRSFVHRGPDGGGVEVFRIGQGGYALGLAHRRLSIIDLTQTGRQPMSNCDESIWITYNGEIYNFKEIRQELELKGYVFKSDSDTETIIYAYQEWGVLCLNKLRGMFAFAIWDKRKNNLFLAVDRFGIKPLYYYRLDEGLFMFASELRSILKSGLIHKAIEPLAVESFLAYGAVQSPITIAKGIFSLLPAHYLIYDLSTRNMQINQYWSPLNSANQSLAGEKEAIEKIRFLLEDSVQKHLISDVPVGVFLSGGIDSSSLAILANRFNKEIRAFSVVFSERAYSEERFSDLVAKKYCLNHTKIRVSEEDLLSLLPGAIDAMDQPTIDGINVYIISKAVSRQGIKAVISGQGGDEIFGGYPTFSRVPLIKRMRSLAGILPFSFRCGVGKGIDLFSGRNVIGSKISQILELDNNVLAFYLILRQLFPPSARLFLSKKQYGNEMLNGLPFVSVDSLLKNTKSLDLFSKISLFELKLYLANMLLRDGDFMSMSHSLEVRVPFLDYPLVESVFNIPSRIKTAGSLPKPLLVKAVKDLLPEEIYLRPKMGFTFPWEIWLKNRLRVKIEDTLNDFIVANALGLDHDACKYLWKMFLENRSGVTWARIWGLYILLNWYKKNIFHG